jgi:hypothetical protein
MRANWLAVACGLILAASAQAQVYVPIPVTGYTQDVIADAGGTAIATTTTNFDEPALQTSQFSYVLYQQGYNTAFPSLGVPSTGSIITSPTRSYQLGPISGNNSLQLIDPGSFGQPVPSGTLTLATPAPYAALSLLLADGVGHQPPNGYPGTLAVNWSNGSTMDYTYIVYDWFLLFGGTPGPNSGFAITGLDRAARTTGTPDNNTTDPRLYYYDIDLSADPNYLAGSLIDSVTAIRQPGNPGSDTTNIMGLSGATAVPEPSTFGLLGAAASLAVWRRQRRAH